MTRTVNQSNRFHALLTQRRFDKEDKTELVKAFTSGRETSSSRMTMDEMAGAIKHLEDEQQTSIKKMRSKIINIARDIFGLRQNDQWEQEHYDRLNDHLYGDYKTLLHKLTYDQLRHAITGMERWRDHSTTQMVREIMGEAKPKRGRPKKETV